MDLKQLSAYTRQFLDLVKHSTDPYKLPRGAEPTEHKVKHHITPKGEEFINKEPPHLFENPFQEQVDLDVDQINPEELHPDAPEFQMEPAVEEGEAGDFEGGIVLDPKRRARNIENRKRRGPFARDFDREND